MPSLTELAGSSFAPFRRLSGERKTASTLLLWSTWAATLVQFPEGKLHGPVSTAVGVLTRSVSGGHGWPVNWQFSLPAIVLLPSTSSVKKLPRYLRPEGAVT